MIDYRVRSSAADPVSLPGQIRNHPAKRTPAPVFGRSRGLMVYNGILKLHFFNKINVVKTSECLYNFLVCFIFLKFSAAD